MSIKVRIAPSPTGNLHFGVARAALFNWLFARKHGGKFLIRIEDTDLERSDPHYEENIISGLAWLGIASDEPVTRQSERLDVYRKYLKQLLDNGKAIVKTFSEEEKAAIRKEGRPARDSIIVLAMDTDESAVAFDDEIRGRISVERKHIGSVALAKDENTPLYNFAATIDDIDMGITHVIRGEDHIPNTPKQFLIYEALGVPPPKFAHLPLILNPDKTKLSKRKNPTSISDYQKDYLSEALVNFMGFLGYTYSREIISKEDMAREFELSRVHKSGAVFDVKKLNWINTHYARQLSPELFRALTGVPVPAPAIPLITERLERLSDAGQYAYLWRRPEYDAELLVWKDSPRQDVRSSLEETRKTLGNIDFGDKNAIRSAMDGLAERLGNKGLTYWPFRAALTGARTSPDPVDVAAIVGRDEVLQRLDVAIAKL